MRKIVAFLVFFMSTVVVAQSGFLGSLNSFEINWMAGPSLRHTNVLKGDEQIYRLRGAYNKFQINYSRVTSKNFQVSFGYNMVSGRMFTEGSVFVDRDTVYNGGTISGIDDKYYSFLQDPKFITHSGSFRLKFYRLGSLAPVGKYIGFAFEYGVTTLSVGDEIVYGKADLPNKAGFIKEVSDVAIQRSFFLTESVPIKHFSVKGMIGRNYPITDQLMINVGMNFPLFTIFNSASNSILGFELNPGTDVGEESDTQWDFLLMNSIKKYNQISFTLGINYHF